MAIRFAHLHIQGNHVAVFEVARVAHFNDDQLRASLEHLTRAARQHRLRVDKAALQYDDFGQRRWVGTPDLVRYLKSVEGIDRWTHELEV